MTLDETRRRFLSCFSGIGLGGTLLPGVLWSQMQQDGAQKVTPEMLKGALGVSGLSFSEDDQTAMLQSLNGSLTRYEEIRNLHIPNNVAPPFYFSPLTPGMKVNRTREPLRFSTPAVKRPANLEDAAFWPITQLAQLIKTRQATSTELTKMYLARLHKYNEKLNCVVTFLDEVALAQAKQADSEIAAGKYKGPLHGIPWGAKDIIAVKGYKTTWGSGAYKDQMLDEEASLVEMLRDAGAVLLAKLTTGELAQGDQWFGGQTKNPWNLEQGSSGSSAGPASATAAGLVAFGIGSETSGSILSPSARCGVTGLRPTFGRISRYGVMALSWTQDRMGPLCRYAEDCALVMSVIARPDGRDLSVTEIPFNYNTHLDIRKLRVGYLEGGFEETRDPLAKKADEQSVEQIQSLGFKLVPVKVPEWTIDTSSIGVESGVFFDDLIRSGRDKQMTNPGRAASFRSSRLTPAVEYLQGQRARSMMMAKLAEATADVDVYLVPVNSGGGGGGAAGRGRGAAGAGATAAAGAAAGRGRGGGGAGANRSVVGRHFGMANLACYPALNVVNGFAESGSPLNITFYARPYGEADLLAFGKAYQDAAGFHLKHPALTA
ncbi:MAG TPA: amidase [Candidatus Sulfopaludibacter sp.]|jgi:Asp-tRNA(Asn)/Glu-tRNA(Gln) amidotransferase A subunit family amidase|nr:amidase [Candidatus Sulfopaludibacter sp.]